MKHSLVLCLSISLSVTLTAQSAPESPGRPVSARWGGTPPTSARIVESYGKLPLAFEANQGQTDPQVKFLSRGAGYSLFLTSTEAVLALSEGSQPEPAAGGARAPLLEGAEAPALRTAKAPISRDKETAVLRMKLVGANAKAEVIGQAELPGKSNYFIGNDSQKWHMNVRQFAKVRYGDVYPGIDLVYYGHQRELEYDFVLQPGANPHAIRLGIEGARKLRIEHGDLVLASAAGDIHLRSPHIYQEVNGIRQKVRGKYVIKSNSEVGFEVVAYDRRRALVIDPVLAYSTYLGVSCCFNGASGRGIAVDSAGNAYVTGWTNSTSFPIVNAVQPAYGGGGSDAFVTKFNADGSGLISSTYLGGSGDDHGLGIAVDSAGNAYVTGWTTSSDFPTLHAVQPAHGGGVTDAFVTRINAAGNALVYSTYLGGTSDDQASGIAVDNAGKVYVTGATYSADFPTKNAIQPTSGGGEDAFVAKFKSGGALVYSTYLGGAGDDNAGGVAVDLAGNTFVTGSTNSTDFPTANAIQATNHGGVDGFVTKINAAGTALPYSTYLGGTGDDQASGIAVDAAQDAYVTGSTRSSDFPTLNAVQFTFGGGSSDAFVTKISADGNGIVYSTYLGGSGADVGIGIALNSSGDVYATGVTQSFDFPTVNAIQPSLENLQGGFVTKINASGNALVYSTYLGGESGEVGGSSLFGVAVDPADSTYLVGYSSPFIFPITLLAFQTSGDSVVVAKIASETFVQLSTQKLVFATQLIGTTSAAKKIKVTNQGSAMLTINRIYIGGTNAGDYTETNTCGSALASGANCTVFVTFAPTSKNRRTAALGISDSDPASPQAIALIGTGTVVSLSPTSLSFGDQPLGTSSAPQSVTVTNHGSTPLNFTTIKITGTDHIDFSETNNCGTSIAPGASCAVSVTFRPLGTGPRKAFVYVGDNGGGSPQRVTLTGTGT